MSSQVILDGFHAVKHAMRFGAKFSDIVTVDTAAWRGLAKELAPDVAEELIKRARVVSAAEFAKLSNPPHPTGIAAVAERPTYKTDPSRATERKAPAILLENPRHLGNIGAVIRVAAAAGASGILTTGTVDPWHPAVVRGAAGLHYALPVERLDQLKSVEGPLLVFDDKGTDIREIEIHNNAVLAFGTERHGVSDELRQRADAIVSLPMQPGVSSLNLATSVAAVLYYWRLKQLL